MIFFFFFFVNDYIIEPNGDLDCMGENLYTEYFRNFCWVTLNHFLKILSSMLYTPCVPACSALIMYMYLVVVVVF